MSFKIELSNALKLSTAAIAIELVTKENTMLLIKYHLTLASLLLNGYLIIKIKSEQRLTFRPSCIAKEKTY